MNSYNEGFSWCSGKPTAKNYSEFIWYSESAWSGQNVYTIIIMLTISLLSQRKSVMNKFKKCVRCAYLASVTHSLGSIVLYDKTGTMGSTTNLAAVVLNQTLLPVVSFCSILVNYVMFFLMICFWFIIEKLQGLSKSVKFSDRILEFHVFPLVLSYHFFIVLKYHLLFYF